MKRLKESVRLCVFSLCACIGTLGVVGLAGEVETDPAKAIFEAMLQSASRIKNITCKAEYLDWRSESARRESYERALKAGQPARWPLREYVAYRYGFTFDDQGRFRVEELQATGDAEGNILAVDLDNARTWDGETAMYQYGRSQGRIIRPSRPPMEVTLGHQDPADIFRESFCRILRRAVSRDGWQVRVQTEAGKHRVEVLESGRLEATAVVDPARGYSVPQWSLYDGKSGNLWFTCEARYEEVAPGVWYPVEGAKVVAPGGKPVHKRTVKVTHVVVNDPNFSDAAFRIDFPVGARIQDVSTGLYFTVGESMSLGTSADPTEPTAGKIADAGLIDLKGSADPNGKSTLTEVFLPKADKTLRRNRPFVLDAKTGKLLYPSSLPDSQQARQYLEEAGKGDLAWDGRIVATRGATVVTPRQESRRALKAAKGEWVQRYELPTDVKLPYWIVLVTKENGYYLLGVRAIEENGIRVGYRRLASGEVAFHVPPPAQTSQKP